MMSPFIPKALFISSVFTLVQSYKTGTPTGFPFVNKYSYISPIGLKSLFVLERTLHNSLSQYTATLQPSILSEQLKLYSADYEESTLKALKATGKVDTESLENLSRSPILAFRTVWRFVKYLRRWADPGLVMPKNQASKFKEISLLLAQHYNTSHGPTSIDYEDAKTSLTRIVHTFTLDIQQFAAGNISGKHAGVGLTAAQCIEIGRFAIKKQLYVTGVEFMEAALDKVELGDISVKLPKARELVQAAYNAHDDAFEGKAPSDWGIDLFTKTMVEVSGRAERIRGSEVVPSSLEKQRQDKSSSEKYQFQTVCKGIHPRAQGATSKLFCWYEHQVDPTFKIGPLKAEFVGPGVVKFHRLISVDAISGLKKNMSRFREIMATREGMNRLGKPFPDRLGVFAGLHPSQYAGARLIADLVGRATGWKFSERNLEMLHVTAYTPGSYLHCHQDLVDSIGETYDSRAATFMVYLSDVEEGGGTGFCESGILVKPEAGSALLWFNILASGTLDLTYDHCSCPVVYGEKWVAATWIYMGPQSHLQCSPDQSKKLEYLVNKKSVADLLL